jgi:superoxide dismutase, Fe-Mn family
MAMFVGTCARVPAVMSATYSLPELPYPLDSLEPWCPAETLELHHTKHHAAYVKGANDAAAALETVNPANAPLLAGLRSALTFNLAGHLLHSLFWKSLSPTASAPTGNLAIAVAKDFGSVERLNTLLAATAMGVHGSGWATLRFDPVGQRLEVAAILDHQNDVVPGGELLAVIDVWEHAYYLAHRNDRAAWVKAAVEHLDWAGIGDRFGSTSPDRH